MLIKDAWTPSQIASDWNHGIQLLHCEGYCLYRPQLAKEMMMTAKAAGALVSMDLASFEVGILYLTNPGCYDTSSTHVLFTDRGP